MAHSSRAKLRASVTGEPYQLAAEWIAQHGLADGLVPDAQLPAQQLAEAAVLVALARPQALPVLAPSGTLYGLGGAEPSRDRLILRPAGEDAAAVLARLLPAEADGRISGVPLLRTGKVTNTTIVLRLPGAAGMEAVELAVRATRAHRRHAERLQGKAGLAPLWTGSEQGGAELAAWRGLARSLSFSQAQWSRALRRPALFRSAHPDWSASAPTDDHVTVPVDVSRFEPRSVAPRSGDRGAGLAPVVAVTAEAGGTGGTTVALGAAAGLARRGLNVAVIVEPGLLDGPLREYVAETPGDWVVLDSPATGRLEAAMRDAAALRRQLRVAQERADVVVVDPTGATARGVRLPVDPDVSLVIAPEKSVWGAWLWREHQRLDHRPAEVRMAAWLSERFERFTQNYVQEQPFPSPETLGRLLDERFALVAAERSSEASGEGAEDEHLYGDVVDDAELLEEWWTPGSREFAVEPDDELPSEAEEVLNSWRAAFLQQMEAEGRRRFGTVWEAAAAVWPARNRARYRLGLHPTALEPETVEAIRRAFLEEVAAEAAELWGELWPGHGKAWAEASGRGQDLAAGWAGHIEVRTVARTPNAVTADLSSVLSQSSAHRTPTGTTILVRNKVRREDCGTTEQVDSVARHLAESGIMGLCEIPSDMSVRMDMGAAVLAPRGGLAEAFDRLADLVAAHGLSG